MTGEFLHGPTFLESAKGRRKLKTVEGPFRKLCRTLLAPPKKSSFIRTGKPGQPNRCARLRCCSNCLGLLLPVRANSCDSCRNFQALHELCAALQTPRLD